MEHLSQYTRTKKQYIGLVDQIGGKSDPTYIDFITSTDIKRIVINDIDAITDVLSRHFIGINRLLCLDFHGVSDLYDDDEKIPSDLPKCIISYIGGNPQTIKNTIDTIRPRILSDEVILGIIVYRKDHVPTCGTKGWIVSKIIEVNRMIGIHFIDDSKKNIRCIENVGSNQIKTYLINKYNEPKKYLTKLLGRIS